MPYHTSTARWRVIVAHRRAGKTVAAINGQVKTALTCPLPSPRTAYVAPFLKQAKTVAWDYLKHYTAPIPGVQWNEAELRADFPNGGQVRLYGADNADALRGIYLDDVDCDEFGDWDPSAWTEVIRPRSPTATARRRSQARRAARTSSTTSERAKRGMPRAGRRGY
jgi:phage terminase large subunit